MSIELRWTFAAVVLLTAWSFVHEQQDIDTRRWRAHVAPLATLVGR